MPSPRVTVCIPVYNGERYVAGAIASALGQTFADVEVIVADNASTDRTADVAREAAARDSRVRYLRSDVNRGLAWNYNRAFEAARGEFVVWLGADDLLGPEFVARCVEALRQKPAAVLSFANSHHIDAAGRVIGSAGPINPGESDVPSERFHEVLFDALCGPIGGMMRTETLRLTRLHLPYADSDRVLLAELALRGRFVLLPEPLASRRMHPEQTTSRYADRRQRTLIFDPGMAGKASYPWWREVRDLVGAIRRAPISRREQWRSLKSLNWWCRAHRRFLVEELRRRGSGAVDVGAGDSPRRHGDTEKAEERWELAGGAKTC